MGERKREREIELPPAGLLAKCQQAPGLARSHMWVAGAELLESPSVASQGKHWEETRVEQGPGRSHPKGD